jgi:hypothetical protein
MMNLEDDEMEQKVGRFEDGTLTFYQKKMEL